MGELDWSEDGLPPEARELLKDPLLYVQALWEALWDLLLLRALRAPQARGREGSLRHVMKEELKAAFAQCLLVALTLDGLLAAYFLWEHARRASGS